MNEIVLPYTVSGIIVSAAVYGQDRTTMWNGSAMQSISLVSLSTWKSALIVCDEQLLSTGESTFTYVGDFPAVPRGEYCVLFYRGASPSPSSLDIGEQSIEWGGLSVVGIPEIDSFGHISTDSSDVVASGYVTTVTNNGQFNVDAYLSTTNDAYNGMWLVFIDGGNRYIPRIVGDYVGATQEFFFNGNRTMTGAFPATVMSGDAWKLLAGVA